MACHRNALAAWAAAAGARLVSPRSRHAGGGGLISCARSALAWRRRRASLAPALHLRQPRRRLSASRGTSHARATSSIGSVPPLLRPLFSSRMHAGSASHALPSRGSIKRGNALRALRHICDASCKEYLLAPQPHARRALRLYARHLRPRIFAWPHAQILRRALCCVRACLSICGASRRMTSGTSS